MSSVERMAHSADPDSGASSAAEPETRSGVDVAALHAAVAWLCRSHDVTGRRGCSKGYSLVRGWLPAYPETSGYIIGTLLAHADRTGNADLVERAVQIGRWEASLQLEDGGVMGGTVETRPRRSVVFNTGMVLHGWIDLINAGVPEFSDCAARAAAHLVELQHDDGTWAPRIEYRGIPHTYNARVAWAMLRWHALADDGAAHRSAVRHLDWVVSRQSANGWFRDCAFESRSLPSTHGLSYTMRGLLESAELCSRVDYLESARMSADRLLDAMHPSGRVPATFSESWTPRASYECLTGTAQLAGIWLRLYQMTGEQRYLRGASSAVRHVASHQVRSGSRQRLGALAGSHPIWGRYAPLQYPNWAAKFLADTLMLHETVTAGCGCPTVEPPRNRAATYPKE